MPAHDYQCSNGHKFEVIVPPSKVKDRVRCRTRRCRRMAEIVWSTGTVRSGQRFTPIVVHVDKEGNVSFPGRNDARVPQGFEKKTLTSLEEARKFSKEFNQREQAQTQMRQHIKEAQFNEAQKGNRSELRTAMNRMSPMGRDFAQYAMQQNDKRRRAKAEVNGFFEVAEYDASNREAQRDASTDWKPRGK